MYGFINNQEAVRCATDFSENSLRWLETILEERFGYYFRLEQCRGSIVLRLHDADGSIVFDSFQPEFHNSSSSFPCGYWNPEPEGWQQVLKRSIPTPGKVHLPTPLIDVNECSCTIHFDILGLVYWMLTRLEEVDRADLDEHNRFPATSSHAFINNYLGRPIVDEWLVILGQVIQRQWPSLELKKHCFKILLSHDVDSPSRYGFRNPKSLLRGVVGDVLLRRNPKAIYTAPWIRLNTKYKLHPQDTFNTFDWIMDHSDSVGIRSAFYFVCGKTHHTNDPDYEVGHPSIRSLIRHIHDRGHEVGLHPSYNTYRNPQKLLDESKRLLDICDQEGVAQQYFGGRMHYLRWEQPTTMLALENANMTYDSTLGYADHAGFRCGTCHEYPAFDPTGDHSLSLRLRPLICMEASVLSNKYMGVCTGEALEIFLNLKEECKFVDGYFTFLWHNSELYNEELRKIYLDVVT